MNKILVIGILMLISIGLVQGQGWQTSQNNGWTLNGGYSSGYYGGTQYYGMAYPWSGTYDYNYGYPSYGSYGSGYGYYQNPYYVSYYPQYGAYQWGYTSYNPYYYNPYPY